ncbi:MAG: hypothetical protein K6A69_01230 [Lachnospiraceae bacterium]|nr:hypothetical protein [Lachnospiraceae bacterium]
MHDFLYNAVEWVANIHNIILSLNDSFEYNFNDKELHFIVIGILGMIAVFLIHPVFVALSRFGHTMVITWIYVFTLMIVLTFAIEIGQRLSGTGAMEFSDIVFGLAGFIIMFAVFGVIREIVKAIYRTLKKKRRD